MQLRRRPVVLLIVGALWLGLDGLSAAARPVPLPDSMASVGDSITRAFDVGWCCVLRDSPRLSWSTGDKTNVASHYRRLLALGAPISGANFNDAESGADMADLEGQLAEAAAQDVAYVTILMGANDVCTESISSMTDPAVFEAEFRAGLERFTAANPDGLMFVASIPNVYQLWQILHGNPLARSAWDTFDICQSMLNENNTEADRQFVLQRERDFNAILQEACGDYSQCLWDGYATFNYSFSRRDVSTVDYFHPSLRGQNVLAAVTWAAGYWP